MSKLRVTCYRNVSLNLSLTSKSMAQTFTSVTIPGPVTSKSSKTIFIQQFYQNQSYKRQYT